MSKYVKNLITDELKGRLVGVEDALLVNVIGLTANDSVALRRDLRSKDISLLVVKNSLAKRATEGTPLAAAFTGNEGSMAVVWGAEDFVSLAKEIAGIEKSGGFKGFETRGGVLDGEQLTADRVKEISKWPNREEQLSILVGQFLSPGANLAGGTLGPGGALASQISKIADGEGPSAGNEGAEPAASTEGAEPSTEGAAASE